MLLPAFLLGSFEKVLSYVIFTDALTLAVVASTLFVLRRRGAPDAYSMPGYPLLPGLYLACLVGVALHVLVTEPRLASMGLVILATGWPLFRLGRRMLRTQAPPDSPGSGGS